MSTDYEREVVDLHQFFEDWFTGKLPRTDDALARFSSVLDAEFCIIAPNGQISNRDEIIAAVNGGYGRRDAMRIWIEQTQLRQQHDDLLIVTYEEWQDIAGVTTSRTSTVFFKRAPEMPNGLRWLHVHESGLKTIE